MTPEQATLVEWLELLDEIEARANAATAGPWEADKYSLYIWGKDSAMVADSRVDEAHLEVKHDPIIRARGVGGKLPIDENMKFIAHARADIPLLAAEVRRLRASEAIYKREILATDSIVKIGESETVVTANVKTEIERLRADLSEARKEMRERAAKTACIQCREGLIPVNDRHGPFFCAGAPIRALPLSPEGEKT